MDKWHKTSKTEQNPSVKQKAAPSELSDFIAEDVRTMSPTEQQRRLDQLLDQWRDASPEQQGQLEERIRSLQASLMEMIRKTGAHSLTRSGIFIGALEPTTELFQEMMREAPRTEAELLAEANRAIEAHDSPYGSSTVVLPISAEDVKEVLNRKVFGESLFRRVSSSEWIRTDLPPQGFGYDQLELRVSQRKQAASFTQPQWRAYLDIVRDTLAQGREATTSDLIELGRSINPELDEAGVREALRGLKGFEETEPGIWTYQPAMLREKKEPMYTPGNPPPMPQPGQSSGLWGHVEETDLDEIMYLIGNDRDLYEQFTKEMLGGDYEKWEQFYSIPIAEIPDKHKIMNWMWQNWAVINSKFLYPFQEELKQSGPGELHVEDVPATDPEAERDKALDAFNKGEIDMQELESRLQRVRKLEGSRRETFKKFAEGVGETFLVLEDLKALNPAQGQEVLIPKDSMVLLKDFGMDPVNGTKLVMIVVQDETGGDDLITVLPYFQKNTRPAKSTQQVMKDLPTVDPEKERDRLLDQYNQGEITEDQLSEKLRKLQSSLKSKYFWRKASMWARLHTAMYNSEEREILADLEYDSLPGCPMCSGEGQPLGQLGNLMHYRCRNCGMQFSQEAEPPMESEAADTVEDDGRLGLYEVPEGATCPECGTAVSADNRSKFTMSPAMTCPSCRHRWIIPKKHAAESSSDGTPPKPYSTQDEVNLEVQGEEQQELPGMPRPTEPVGRLDKTTTAYLGAMLWSGMDAKDEPLDKNYSLDDIDLDTINQSMDEIEMFRNKAGDLLDGVDDEMIGHDFWLTRNGHGAGFWDRGLGEVGEKLTEIAKSFGEAYPYVDGAGKVHIT